MYTKFPKNAEHVKHLNGISAFQATSYTRGKIPTHIFYDLYPHHASEHAGAFANAHKEHDLSVGNSDGNHET